MRKIITGFKVSVDAKSEGPDGVADWVDAWSEDYGLSGSIDACLLGGGMYPGYEGYWTGIQNDPAKPVWEGGPLPTPGEIEWANLAKQLPHYVLSNTLSSANWPNTKFIRSLDAIAAMKNAPGKDIYLMGGAKIAASMIDAGLVDELRLIVYPLIAGPGTALFGTSQARRKLELREVRQLSGGRFNLIYAIDQSGVGAPAKS
jgi:dihydrofolate reductase